MQSEQITKEEEETIELPKSSRIIVKNLPLHLTEKRFRQYFSSQGGCVTDAKIMFKGTSHRRFGFIGYKTEKQAEKAVNYYNNTFIDTSQIVVEYAKPQENQSLKKRKQEAFQKKRKIKQAMKLTQKSKKAHKVSEIKSIKSKAERFKQQILGQGVKQQQEGENNNNKEQQKIQSKPQTDQNRLFINNLPYIMQQNDIRNQFQQYGQIDQIKIPRFPNNGGSKGCCILKFNDPSSAISAMSQKDKTFMMGRKIHIILADKQRTRTPLPQQEQAKILTSSFKRKQDMQKAANYSNERSWNFLYINPDAIATSIARELNVSKGNLLRCDNIAIKLAESQSHLIDQVKLWMKQQLEINPQLLKSRDCERSQNILLVKNILDSEDFESLNQLFSRYGVIKRLKISPMNSFALVEYQTSHSAEIALKKLQEHVRKRGKKQLPLYLQRAPVIFQNKFIDRQDKNVSEQRYGDDQAIKENQDKKSKLINNSTIFVKNLNFTTQQQALRNLFQKCIRNNQNIKSGKILSTKVIKKNGLSCGYGFIQVDSHNLSQQLIKCLQNSMLDEHSLKLSISKHTNQPQPTTNKKSLKIKKQAEQDLQDESKVSNKIIIKNIAFQANQKQLTLIFKKFGGFRKLRLPTKITGGHRGFAFVEFTSSDYARKAFQGMRNSHLYGKKFVIQWAKVEGYAKDVQFD